MTDPISSVPDHSEPSPKEPKESPKPKPQRLLGRLLQIFGALFILLAILVAGSLGSFYWWAHRDLRKPGALPTLDIEIASGDSLRTVAKRLEKTDVASPWPMMVLLAIWKKADQGIQTGHFRFTKGQPPVEILEQLRRGPSAAQALSVTLPEGWTTKQMAQRLGEKKALANPERFLALCRDPEFLRSLNIPALHAEGYLFPDTYFFTPGTDEKQVIRRLAARFQTILLSPEHLGLLPGTNSPNAYPLTCAQSVVLASIIQREARETEEMKLISSVYHNRLRKGMRLESCATVRHALENWDKALTLEDLKTDSPFNTYVIKGLPPQPICNPGREALEAAFRPEKSDFLYYVYKGDGRHAFTSTLRDHLNARRKYKDAWSFPAKD